MATLLSEQDFDVRVTYCQFSVQESHDTLIPSPYPDGAESGTFLKPYPMRLDFGSAGHTHTASAVVQVWNAEPDPDSRQSWDETAESQIETVSGELGIWSMERADETIKLGSAGRWRVRVSSGNRNEVARVTREVGVAYGVERWLLQFWPEANRDRNSAEAAASQRRNDGSGHTP
ncbi:hypothetical protein [Streptomyces morookaense]|uniref:Uncharacterized protein n=1 Tax=Streptomyces morookaense TaxID=1970 RepID=A0A7Y7EAA7_STRMO|nr:hypothetical protein [Streptomyces morookaense]NVK81314.1 hypothetical protein [Streptomyces morookaense]GHF35343.1 hypothetical protein GCM10010359_42360 [Streptomyces morookaense]